VKKRYVKGDTRLVRGLAVSIYTFDLEAEGLGSMALPGKAPPTTAKTRLLITAHLR
jgi:hypothetical protein